MGAKLHIISGNSADSVITLWLHLAQNVQTYFQMAKIFFAINVQRSDWWYISECVEIVSLKSCNK